MCLHVTFCFYDQFKKVAVMSDSTSWGSRLGFILASAGSAVGLGAIWKFPYMAGSNGGSVFMLPYIIFTFTVGLAMLISEYAIGRAGRAGPIGSMRKIVGRYWGFFGGVGMLTAFLILCFYSCVGGWCLKYLVDAVIGKGLISDAAELNNYFGSFVSNPVEAYAYQLLFLFLNAVIVVKGVEKGIEAVAKVLMPVLFIMMLILIVRGLTLPGAWAGVEYLFMPRWEDVTADTIFNALGFTFFSLSLGAATMVTYAGYLSEKANLVTSTAWVAFLAILAAIMGGLMVMPVVFAFNLSPTAGPGLTFVTMPAIFSQLPLGQLFAILFYLCLFVAAITSSVSMLEPMVATFVQETHYERKATAIGGTVVAAIIGFFCTLSFGPTGDVKFFGRNFFDLLDFLTSNIGMPVSEIGFSIAAGWMVWKVTERQLTTVKPLNRTILNIMRFMIAIMAPAVIITVMVTGLL